MNASESLLVLKAGGDYFRIEGEEFRLCTLDKASVFPLSALETVEQHRARLRGAGFPESDIYRLTIHEAPLCAGGPDGPPSAVPEEGMP